MAANQIECSTLQYVGHHVGFGCRIHRLHLCRGVNPHHGTTCWPWVATRKALGRDPSG